MSSQEPPPLPQQGPEPPPHYGEPISYPEQPSPYGGQPPYPGEPSRYGSATSNETTEPYPGNESSSEGQRLPTEPLPAPQAAPSGQYRTPMYPVQYVPEQQYQPGTAPRRRRRGLGCCLGTLVVLIVLVAVIVVIGSILGFGFGVAGFLRNSAVDPARTFTMNSSPTLILNNLAGSVTIQGSGGNTISVQATRYASFGGNVNDMHVAYSQSGNTLNVTAARSGAFNFFNATSVDFRISVPSSIALQIMTSAGSISVTGVTGTMTITTNAGSINVTQASLPGSSTLKTNAGSITYNGSLGSTGTYDFETSAGSIDVTLPSSSTFHLNASTSVGSISTSGFSLSANRSTVGATMQGDVGSSPQATLTLKTSAGSISLKSA